MTAETNIRTQHERDAERAGLTLAAYGRLSATVQHRLRTLVEQRDAAIERATILAGQTDGDALALVDPLLYPVPLPSSNNRTTVRFMLEPGDRDSRINSDVDVTIEHDPDTGERTLTVDGRGSGGLIIYPIVSNSVRIGRVPR